jgi:putative endonuclease
MKPYYTYLVRCKDNSLYCGVTNDLGVRIDAHNSDKRKKGAKYTYMRRPVVLVYYEIHATRSIALAREYQIKQLTKIEKEAMVAKFGIGRQCK